MAIELGFELEGITDLVKLKTKIHIIRIYNNLIMFETASNCSKTFITVHYMLYMEIRKQIESYGSS